jgi:hypothetical protein
MYEKAARSIKRSQIDIGTFLEGLYRSRDCSNRRDKLVPGSEEFDSKMSRHTTVVDVFPR